MLSSNAHRICDGSVQPGGLSNRVRNNVQLDLTQQQRVCQTFCCLRSRLPDTGSTYVTSLTTHDPILFTRVYESGPETNTPFHILLVKCILLRSKLSQAVESNLAMNIRDRFISEIRKVSPKLTDFGFSIVSQQNRRFIISRQDSWTSDVFSFHLDPDRMHVFTKFLWPIDVKHVLRRSERFRRFYQASISWLQCHHS